MKTRTILLGLAMAALFAVRQASATVTPYSWIRSGEAGSIFVDSSGTGHNFNAAFSSGPPPAAGGNPAVVFSSTVVAGGPLGGPAGPISTVATRWGFYNFGNSGMWIQGSGNTVPDATLWSLPATNWVMECWILPQNDGRSGGGFANDGAEATAMTTGTGHFGGTARGARFRTRYDSSDDTVVIRCDMFGPGDPTNNFVLGTPFRSHKDVWVHLAVVNNNGVCTFYTNGVASGPSSNHNVGPIVGCVPYIGSGQDTGDPYDGYLDECRYSTFAPGAFVVTDLLTRPPGPNIVVPPQSITVWAGGAAPFRITTAYDASTTYQWRRGTNITGATDRQYVLPTAVLADNGAQFDCVVTASGISKTSTVATLTVIANDPAEIAVFRNLVQNDANLLAYFPADNNTGATLTNVKDGTHNGTLELNAYYTGRTNNAFGQRAVAFNGDGDVQIPNNPAFEFTNGNGTIEAIVYLDPTAGTAPTDQTIFSQATDGGVTSYYYIRASQLGGSLIYGNDAGNALSWVVPGGLNGKQTHVAIVIDHGTNVTAYANGLNLGTQVQTAFGSDAGASSWIGSMGSTSTRNWLYGSVDELAIYGAALSQNTVQLHYSAYFYGTHTAPPSIVSQSPSKTLLAGGSPVLFGTAAGTLPLSYGWKSNGVPIAGANSATLALSNATVSASYTLAVTNAYGFTNSAPIVLTFVAPPSGYATRVMKDAPRALWRLSETNGTTAFDSAGFNDGTYSGGFTLGYPAFQGETGTAALFNGASGKAVVPLASSLNPNNPFTIELWAKFVGGNGGNQVAVSSLDRPSRGAGYEYYHGGNYNGWEFHTGGGGNYDALCGDNIKEPVGVWWHIVGTYNGNNIAIFINGQPGNVDPTAVNSPPFTPNTVKDFFIGCRSDNANFFNGAIADVAFYNYVLSSNQIVSHWSSVWVASGITQNPVGVTNVEGSTITLTAIASGLPNTYQWVKDGGNLAAVNNSDGTPHYPAVTANGSIVQGVNGPTLVISQTKPSDSGLYHLVVTNPLGGSQTLDAKVLITLDTNKPTVVSVTGLGTPNPSGPTPYLVKALFNKRIDPATGGDFLKYSIPGATVTGVTLLGDVRVAALGGDFREAIVTTTGLTPGATYNLTVTGVKDQTVTGNTIAPAPVAFKAPSLTQSKLVWDYYYLGSVAGGSVVSLTGDTNYPNAPQSNVYLTAFNSGQFTGDDLNNNATFGALGDNYGCSVSGWIKPTVTEDYTFFLSSDDASELWLSTDATPANAALIAFEPGCCHAFTEPPVTYTSDPQHLVAGVSYFIRALQIEGGGGDYVRVAWRASADTNAAASLTPISGPVLSAYTLAPVLNPVSYNDTTKQLTISWTGTGRLYESIDLKTWTLVGGNPSPFGPYVVNVTSAPAKFYRLGP